MENWYFLQRVWLISCWSFEKIFTVVCIIVCILCSVPVCVQTATLRSRIVGEWFQNSHFENLIYNCDRVRFLYSWVSFLTTTFDDSFSFNILYNSLAAPRMKWVVVLNFHVGRKFSEAVEGDFELITVTKITSIILFRNEITAHSFEPGDAWCWDRGWELKRYCMTHWHPDQWREDLRGHL